MKLDLRSLYRTEWRRLYRTVTFRLALAQSVIFIIFAGALLLVVYFTTAGQLTQEADRSAEVEYQALSQIYSEGGQARLNEELIDRIAAGGQALYVLADQNGDVVSGSFEKLPLQPTAEPRRVTFEFDGEIDGKPVKKSGRGFIGRLLGGQILLVARDMGDAKAIVGRISSSVWTGAVLGLLFSLFAGYSAARQAAKRVDALSKTARDVMAGDLSRRAELRGLGDEFDGLAQDLNAMLARIQKLVVASRTAGDAIAHDLRSPLTRMRQTLEAALQRPPDSTADREALRKAVEETEHVLDTFNTIMQLNHVVTTDNWKFELVDVSAIATDLAEFYGPAAEDSELTFISAIQADISLEGDPRLIVRAMSNLIENAFKYTPRGGSIRFDVRRTRDGAVEVAVVDNGPGVPAHDRERVKERFVRLNPERSKGGAGLGLSLVTAVAEVHKGQFVLEDGLTGPYGPGLRAALTFPKRRRVRSTV